MALGISACDDRCKIDYDLQSRLLFQCDQWTQNIALVRESSGCSYDAYVADTIEANEYNYECDPMVYSPDGGKKVNIIGRHFGVRNCLSKAASTLYSFDKISELSSKQYSALGRAKDFMRISGIMASPLYSKFKVVEKTVGKTTGLNPEKLIAAASILGGNCVSANTGSVNILAGAGAMVGLFESDKASSLFIPGNPLFTGRWYQFMGMMLRFGPEPPARNAIPMKDGDYLALVLHRDALLETVNMDLIREVRPNLVGRIGWEFLAEFVSGLGVLDPKGVVLIKYDIKNEPT